MAHLTIVTKRSSMTHWPIQRNVLTLLPMNNKSNETTTTHILTTHNVNTSSRTTVQTYDDSLTNLSWLHDINILKRTIPTIKNSNDIDDHHSSISNEMNETDDDDDDDEQWKTYRNNPQIKPVYSYSQLILLAMKRSGHEKMTLQMIYEWVADNFPYFKKMEPTWQNSIRHNLSLNKCFIKVPRTKKDTGGKGGFWTLSPEYQRQNSNHGKRIHSTNKRTEMMIKSEPTTTTTFTRMPSSFLSPISSPDAFSIPPFYSQTINDFSSVLTLSPSNSPASKTNFLSTKFDETDILSLDPEAFDWDAYLSETTNEFDVQPLLLANRTEQDLFNDFNAALTDLTYSAETAAAGGDPSAFDGFDYSNKSSMIHSFLLDEEEPTISSTLTVKGRGIKRPAWWLTNEYSSPTKLPSLESAFDLKYSSSMK